MNTAKDNIVLEKDTIDHLNAALSKSSLKLLTILYHSPRLSHKSLAANLHTSPTSLSNILARMKVITPQLLISERTGRMVYYSLTQQAGSYISQVLNTDTSASVQVLSQSELKDAALEQLYQFQTFAGKEWEIKLDDMLSGHKETGNLYNIYNDFIGNMIQLKLNNYSHAVKAIYSVLGNTILVKRTEDFLCRRMEAYSDLLPVFELEKKDIAKTFIFIDYVFMQIRQDVFGQNDIIISSAEFSITEEQYLPIINRVKILIDEFFRCEGKKNQLMNDWKEQYFGSHVSLHYIAEKCNTIYLMESGFNHSSK